MLSILIILILLLDIDMYIIHLYHFNIIICRGYRKLATRQVIYN